MSCSIRQRMRRTATLPAPRPGVSRARIYGVLALGIVCIALSAIFVKLAVGVPGTVSAFYRVAIAAVALAIPFARGQTRKRRASEAHGRLGWRIWALAIIAGVFFALDLGFWNTSLGFTTAANATLLGNDAPLVVGTRRAASLSRAAARELLAWADYRVAWHERHRRLGRHLTVIIERRRSASDVGWRLLCGLSADDAAHPREDGHPAIALGRQRDGNRPPAGVHSRHRSGAGWLHAQRVYGAAWSWADLAACGWLAINYALGHMPASVVSVTLLAQPILTALFAVPLLSESLAAHQIAGGLIALGGIFLVNRGVGK